MIELNEIKVTKREESPAVNSDPVSAKIVELLREADGDSVVNLPEMTRQAFNRLHRKVAKVFEGHSKVRTSTKKISGGIDNQPSAENIVGAMWLEAITTKPSPAPDSEDGNDF